LHNQWNYYIIKKLIRRKEKGRKMKNILVSPPIQKSIVLRIVIIIVTSLLYLPPLYSLFNCGAVFAQTGAESSLPETSSPTPFNQGRSLFNEGKYEEAIPHFEAMITLHPDHTESYFYLGQCYLQQGVIEYNHKNIFTAYSLFRKANEVAEQVIPLYQKGITEDPDNLDNYMKLGYIYEIRSQVPFIDEYKIARQYYLEGLTVLERLENNPLSNPPPSTSTPLRYDPYRSIKIYFHWRIGYLYWLKKDYSQAIDYLKKAEELSPQHIEVNYYLGLSYAKIGDEEKAQHYLSRVMELAPQSELAREAEKELGKINKDKG